ncbi:MAG: OmpA family protein [Smithella sp.]
MKKNVVFLVTMALLIFVSAGYAQINPRSFSVTPFIGGYTFEGNENTDTSMVYGLRAGYNFTKNWGVEGFFNYAPAHLKEAIGGDDSLKLYGYGVEALYHFMPEKRLVPFLAVGAGGTHYSQPDGIESNNKFTLDYGAGLKFFLTDWLALRADVRHVLPLNDRYNNLLYTFGINFAFGGAKKVAETVQEQPAQQAPPPPPPVEKPAPKEEMKPEAQAEPEILEKGRTTLNVQFDTGKAIIKKSSYKDIDKLVDVMKNYPDLNVTIEGHTDNVGKAAGNKKLSQKRADAVKAYMVKQGIDTKRVTAKGYGSEKPIASNATKAGKAKNRRVEAAVDYTIKK